jgi:hypothetical protein
LADFGRNLVALPGQPEQCRQARIQVHHHEDKTNNDDYQDGLLKIKTRPGFFHINILLQLNKVRKVLLSTMKLVANKMPGTIRYFVTSVRAVRW